MQLNSRSLVVTSLLQEVVVAMKLKSSTAVLTLDPVHKLEISAELALLLTSAILVICSLWEVVMVSSESSMSSMKYEQITYILNYLFIIHS